MQKGMGWGPLPQVKGWVRTALAISPLLPVIVASLYFSRDLRWSPGYPVRIPWDQIPTIASAPSPGVASLTDEWALTVPILAGDEEGDPSSGSDDKPGAGTSDDSEAGGREGNRPDAGSQRALVAIDGVMPLSFDLVGRPAGERSLQVRKSVSFNQQALGTLSVHIDDFSRVHVSVLDMSRMFPEPHRPPRSWQGEYVLLSEVRAAGIDLRYDPTADQFILKDGSSN